MTDMPPPQELPSLPEPPSLVQRIDALEAQHRRILDMMNRDREWLDDLRERIGL